MPLAFLVYFFYLSKFFGGFFYDLCYFRYVNCFRLSAWRGNETFLSDEFSSEEYEANIILVSETYGLLQRTWHCCVLEKHL